MKNPRLYSNDDRICAVLSGISLSDGTGSGKW